MCVCAGLFCNEIYDGDGSPMASASSNLAASWFGYAVGNMAELGFYDVGQDQLAGGPPPDNERTVSMLDWNTGQPNAKYFSVQVRHMITSQRLIGRLTDGQLTD